ENLSVPCRAIAGPWAHQYPHLATPGPAADFLGEAADWWRQWLDGEDTGQMSAAAYRAFAGEGGLESVNGYAANMPGRWLASDWHFESYRDHEIDLFLSEYGLTDEKILAPPLSFCSPVDTGTAAGELIPHCLGPEMAVDHRPDDGGGLSFDSAPLVEPVDLWGDAELVVTLSSNRPTGNLIVWLTDVSPEGASKRVTHGMLNLLQRDGDHQAVPMPVDEPVTIRIKLDHVCHRFNPGHRIRLVLSTAYWPLVWPAPDNPTLTLAPELAILTLPAPADAREIDMAHPVAPPSANMRVIKPPKNERRVIHDQAKQRTIVEILDYYGEIEYVDNGMVNLGIKRERFEIGWLDHLSAEHHLHWTHMLRRGEWQVSTETKAKMTCDKNYFYLQVSITAFEQDAEVWRKIWEAKSPRLFGHNSGST
ncbi:MAG: CocE/NonD family hydrolase C-terminal non-catalytic domain-containing protein, partial [Chloroflexota bacterium]